MLRFSHVVGFLMMQVNFTTIVGVDPKLVLLNVVLDMIDSRASKMQFVTSGIHAWVITLESVYMPELLESRSSRIGRTQMSAQLVLSGLFPPTPIQQWNKNSLWQPIPTVNAPIVDDIQFLPFYCSSAYVTEHRNVLATPEVQDKIAQFDGLMATLEKFSGSSMNDILDLNTLYFTFAFQSAAHLKLEDWVKEFYPDGELRDASILNFELFSYNDELKKKFGGTLLRKITDDIRSYASGTLKKSRKLFHYSGHDVNIATLQAALGVWEPHIPAYTSAIILEVWKQEDDLYVKVLYYKGIPAEIVIQQIPGCDVLCPFDKFLELLKPVLATDSDYSCNCQPKPEFCRDYWRRAEL